MIRLSRLIRTLAILGTTVSTAFLCAVAWAQVIGSLDDVIRRRQEEIEAERAREEARRRQPTVRELKDDRARVYLEEILQRILKQTNISKQDRVRVEILEWEVVNAFVTPEMKVYVTTGLLELIESDDELACVIGHELAHVAARHLAGRTKQAVIWQAVAGLAAALGKGRDAIIGGQLLGNLKLLQYSRKQEMEADRLGLRYARDAGYDPSGIIHFMRKMGQIEGKMDDPVSTWLSSHPPAPHRIQQATQFLKSEGLKESKLAKLSFNIRSDRQVIDLYGAIEGSSTTSGTATVNRNILVNGALVGSGESVPNWRTNPPGSSKAILGGGILLSTMGNQHASLRSEPTRIDSGVGHIVRLQYRAEDDVELKLLARLLDSAGRLLSETKTVAPAKKGEEGCLSLDLGGVREPIPAGATHLEVELDATSFEKATVRALGASIERTLDLSASRSVAGNLIPNPSFEESDASHALPLRWTIVSGKASLDPKNHAAGKVSLKVTASTKDWALIRSDLVPINPKVDYLLSGSLKTNRGNQRMSLGLEFYRADRSLISQSLVAAQGVFPPAEFTKYTGIVFASGSQFQIPPKTAFVAVVAMSGYYSSEPCWFDDIVLIRVQKP